MNIYTIGFEEQLKILREKSTPVENIDDQMIALTLKMIETLDGIGIGLAAPQIGINQRFFVCALDDEAPMVFINPELIETSEELSKYEEGCLSIPDNYGNILRPAHIKVQAWNTRGRPFTLEAGGLMATCIQHEMDHLNGILFIDHMPGKKRDKILKKFQ